MMDLKAILWFIPLIVLLLCCKEEEKVRIPKYVLVQGAIQNNFIAGEEANEAVRVKVVDIDSVAIPNVKVYFTISKGKATRSDSVSITDIEGIASTEISFGTESGNVELKIQAEGLLEKPIYLNFEIGSAIATKIEIISGNNQEGLPDRMLPASLVVKVTDQFDNLVSNAIVEFKIISGSGTIIPSSAETYRGLASAQYTASVTNSVSVVQASVGEQFIVNFNCYTLFPVLCSASLNENRAAVISWTKSESPNFQSYSVYRSRWGLNDYTVIYQTTNVNINSFIDDVNTLGVIYEYYVRTTTSKGYLVDSERVKIEPGNAIILPNAEDADVALDTSKGLFYIATRDREKIFLISASTMKKLDSIVLDYLPYRIALNNDFSKLYLVYSGSNSIDVFSTSTLAFEKRINIPVIGSSSISDIHISKNGDLFVSSIAIVKIDSLTNSMKKVSSNFAFFIERVRFINDDGRYLFMEVSNLIPNSLFKLDINDDDAPMVLRNEHGSVDGTESAQLSANGTRIYLKSGQIVSSEDFKVLTTLPQSVSALALSENGNKLYTISQQSFQNQVLIRWDSNDFTQDLMRTIGLITEQIFFYNNELFGIGKNIQEQWRFFKIGDLPTN